MSDLPPRPSPSEAAPRSAHLSPLHVMLLAHTPLAQTNRCLLLPIGRRRLAICARCFGLYATLLPTLLMQLFARHPQASRADLSDWLLVLGGSLPALVDWSAGLLGRPSRPLWRLVTGALLGLALGRSLFFHLRDPRSPLLWAQALLITVVAAAVLAIYLRRRPGRE